MCQKAQRVSPFMYFGTVRLFKILIFCFFFENLKKIEISLSSKDPPSIYLIFCNKLDFQKARRVPLLQVQKLRFLSLRYSADFRRSRLVYEEQMVRIYYSYGKDHLA